MSILFFRAPAWSLLLRRGVPSNGVLGMRYRLSITPAVSFVIIRCICRPLLRILAMALRISVVLMILLSHRRFLIVSRRQVRSRATIPSGMCMSVSVTKLARMPMVAVRPRAIPLIAIPILGLPVSVVPSIVRLRALVVGSFLPSRLKGVLMARRAIITVAVAGRILPMAVRVCPVA
jgi:hypothetical protein